MGLGCVCGKISSGANVAFHLHILLFIETSLKRMQCISHFNLKYNAPS